MPAYIYCVMSELASWLTFIVLCLSKPAYIYFVISEYAILHLLCYVWVS